MPLFSGLAAYQHILKVSENCAKMPGYQLPGNYCGLLKKTFVAISAQNHEPQAFQDGKPPLLSLLRHGENMVRKEAREADSLVGNADSSYTYILLNAYPTLMPH